MKNTFQKYINPKNMEKLIQKNTIQKEDIFLMWIAMIKKCMCPIFRDEKWNPEIKWSTIYSREYLNDAVAVEILRLKVTVKTRYNLLSHF